LDWPALKPDIDPQLCGARVWWQGGNPYAAVARQICPFSFPQFYPATVFVVLAPLMHLPTLAARAIVAFLGTFALTLAMTRDGWYRLPLLVSAGYLSALVRAQWEPILLAAVVYPGLGGLWCVKPNVGAVCVSGVQDRKRLAIATAGGLSVLIISLLHDPGWVREWLAVLQRGTHHVTPLLAAMSLAALPRFRRPHARVTTAFGLLPFTHLPYTAVLLFLAPQTWRQACAMALASNAAVVISLAAGPYQSFEDQTRVYTWFGAPLVLGVAVWCAWAQESSDDDLPHALLLVTIATSVFLIWLSFAVAK